MQRWSWERLRRDRMGQAQQGWMRGSLQWERLLPPLKIVSFPMKGQILLLATLIFNANPSLPHDRLVLPSEGHGPDFSLPLAPAEMAPNPAGICWFPLQLFPFRAWLCTLCPGQVLTTELCAQPGFPPSETMIPHTPSQKMLISQKFLLFTTLHPFISAWDLGQRNCGKLNCRQLILIVV